MLSGTRVKRLFHLLKVLILRSFKNVIVPVILTPNQSKDDSNDITGVIFYGFPSEQQETLYNIKQLSQIE